MREKASPLHHTVVPLRKTRCQRAVPFAAVLQRTNLRFVIHVHKAKAHAVPFRPFEIVHQAPCEVTPHGVTVLHQISNDTKMFGVIVKTGLIIHLAVFDAHIVAGAIFGDVAIGQLVALIDVSISECSAGA